MPEIAGDLVVVLLFFGVFFSTKLKWILLGDVEVSEL